MTKLVQLVCSIALFSNVIAQNNLKVNNPHWCGTDEYNAMKYAGDPVKQNQMEQQMIEFFNNAHQFHDEQQNNKSAKKALKIIPVVVHVLHYNGDGNISKQQVIDGIADLNAAYRRLNADTSSTRPQFKPYATDCEVEFRLATIDPNGNCTDGIVRVNTPKTYEANDNTKSVSYWNSTQYFNVWLVKSIENTSGSGGVILGYAQFPWNGINSTYGFVCRGDSWGNGDDTPAHEVGHCLGLLHTFQGGCGSNCSTSGDYICDTPPTSTATYGCDGNQNTCSNDANGPDPFGTNVEDMIENYMSYDACQNMFTLEQKSAMQSSFSQYSGLANLVSASNLAARGVADPYTYPPACAPVADFTNNYNMICEGTSVTYSDNSSVGTPTSWNWTFNGGTPSTSTNSTETVTYNTAGTYTTTLTASNAYGSDVETKSNLILVSSSAAQYQSSFYDEDFENATQVANDWIVVNYDGTRQWEYNTTTGSSGTASFRILNYSGNTTGSIDELISPSYNTSMVTNAKLNFKYAYKQKNSNSDDELKVYVSVNCGQTWQLRWFRSGSQLATGSNQSSNFTPTANDWTDVQVSLGGAVSAQNVRIKFQFKAGGGNNIYLDDINISNPSSVAEYGLLSNWSVYPNPITMDGEINFNLTQNVNNASLAIYDMVGKEVKTLINNQSLNKGTHTYNLSGSTLGKGMYLVRMILDGQSITKKIVVQ
ncbi:MAG: hypothetical protein Kow0079_05470 [Vicingaceae bacterium]